MYKDAASTFMRQVLVATREKRELDGCQEGLGLDCSGLLGAFRYHLLDMQYARRVVFA
jgi:hypothetical protein